MEEGRPDLRGKAVGRCIVVVEGRSRKESKITPPTTGS